MLCLNFFKPELHADQRDENYQECWERGTVTERLFPVIMNFFRPEKEKFGDRIEIRNLTGRDKLSHNEEQANDFLVKLCWFLWAWRGNDVKDWIKESEQAEAARQNIVMRTRVEGAKPWAIEILSHLGKLGILDKVLELSEGCLAKLKEIAMRNELSRHYFPVEKDRQIANLEEACYMGSPAAWFLKRYELRLHEHQRLTAILEAEIGRASC